MGNFSIFKIFQIFGIVSTWATKALEDGKITLEEAVDLATKIAALLGVKIEIEVPAALEDMTDLNVKAGNNTNKSFPTWVPESPKPIED